MRVARVRGIGIALCLVVSTGLAAQTQPATSTDSEVENMIARLPPGQAVLPADSLSAFGLIAAPGLARMEAVAVEGQTFAHALRVQTIDQPANLWNLQLSARSAADLKKGDVLLASFRLRCAESPAGEAHAVFVYELGKDPYTKSVEFPASVGAKWKRFVIPFSAHMDLPAGEANINFQLGFAPQTVEIADVSVINYGTNVKLKDLPSTVLGYPGRETDAAWRRAAQERIDKLRKGDLTVSVADASGKAVAGAEVSVKMTRHAFGFGSAVAAQGIMDQSADGAKYRDFIRKNFNKVVFENDLKWPGWENPAGRDRMFKAYEWLHSNAIEVRGHCLVWPSWKNMAPDVKQKKDDKAALAKRIGDHVTEEVAAMRGKLVEWDVINEPFTNHDAQDILGQACMADWFKLARAADPDVMLFINDYAILTQGGLDRAHQDHYEKTIKFLLDSGAAVQGIGMQGHFGWKLTGPERMLEILDRFAKLGLEIEVTEFDADVTDENLQADFTRDFMTTMFSHPKVKGILMWGFWEGRHWRPDGAMVRKDWSLKPNGEAWIDLVHKRWTTDAQGKTGSDGAYKVRGFLGEYEITVASGGKSKTLKASLPHDGATVKVTLGRD